jgi:hypothetical protein
MISRRALVAGAVTAVAAPRSGATQQTGKVYRIGFLWDTPTVWPHALGHGSQHDDGGQRRQSPRRLGG